MRRETYRRVLGIGPLALAIGFVLVASTLALRFGSNRRAFSDYERTCRWVLAERNRMAADVTEDVTDHGRLDAIRELWLGAAAEQIFPAWYGTPWDFNGTAGSPAPGLPGTSFARFDRERKIACGHFVGSVMEDLGFNVDRKAVGRQAAADIIHTFVADPGLIRSFRNEPRDTLFDEIAGMGQGLFIVGLDSHVGFLLSDARGLHFVHASGRFPYCVLREPASKSHNLLHSSLVMVGKFSDDKGLAGRWLSGQQIQVKGGR